MKPFIALLLISFSFEGYSLDKRSEVSFQRGPYVQKFFNNYFVPWSHQSAIHAAHGAAHDIAHVTPPEKRTAQDEKFFKDMVELTLSESSKNGPKMETYGPLVSQFIYDLYRTIDWTHIHHEQTYDIMSDKSISPDDKQKWNDRSVKFYLEKFDIPRSVAPLEVTMRRAGVMMKPYFSYFRNYFPKSSEFFFVAHWWHPAIYEAMYLGMRDDSQKDRVKGADNLLEKMLKAPPQRMILSREMMPQYTIMNPASANIFDNLHMLHGIAYDILTYPNWTEKEKRKELKRVIKAMAFKKGDEKYLRDFNVPRPIIDPQKIESWMLTVDGSMNDIMMEMMNEMMPLMMPDIRPQEKEAVMEQFKKKMTPGMQEGEHEGSLHDAIMHVYPRMKMDKDGMKPGNVPQSMVDMMLKKWEEKK